MIAQQRSGARWMAPVMVVVAGIAASAPAGADGRASDDAVEIPEWQTVFERAGVTGTMVVRRLGERRTFASDLDDAGRGRPPASTFKLANLLVALETGAVHDLDQVYRWDGVQRPVAAWNVDHTVRDALQVSALPVFQRIARSVGEPRMAAWLTRLGYGNAKISGGIDRFWLDGGLRVTPVQQVEFVERLLLGTLPVSDRSQRLVRDAVPATPAGCDAVIRAKTGWARPNGEAGPDIGWWVGWVELPREVWMFASVVEGPSDRVRDARRDAAMAVLERLEVVSRGTCRDASDAAPDGPARPIPAMFRG